MGKNSIGPVLLRLRRLFGRSRAEVEGTPFMSLISTVLSQRTRDGNTALASGRLFGRYRTARGIAGARLDEIERLIRPSGFYRVKARRIREISRILEREYGGRVPADLEKLLELPGVGRKTANCVLVYGFGIPAIPVDTHVHRISNRLGWVGTNEPEETERELARIVPRRHWIELNLLMVRLGQSICLPRRPRCGECPLRELCETGRSGAGEGV